MSDMKTTKETESFLTDFLGFGSNHEPLPLKDTKELEDCVKRFQNKSTYSEDDLSNLKAIFRACYRLWLSGPSGKGKVSGFNKSVLWAIESPVLSGIDFGNGKVTIPKILNYVLIFFDKPDDCELIECNELASISIILLAAAVACVAQKKCGLIEMAIKQ